MNCCRMRSHQSLQAFLALAVLLIGSLAGQSLQPVLADVGDANHIGVGGVHWITRNLADGISIPVCSEVFPKATREAVKRWNEALRVTVLEAYDDHDDCKITKRPTPRNGVLSTIVSKGELINGGADYTGSVLPASCPNDNTSHACAGTELVRGMTSEQNIWRSFYGRGEVIINPTVYCRDVGTAKSKECGVDQSDYNLFEVVAHELGHILALPDYFCGRVGHEDYLEPGTRSLMNSWTAVYACNAIGGKPTELDKEDYRSMYRPGTVVETKGSTDGQVVTLRWNQFNVFAESDFEIQRKNGAIWEMEEIAEANAESITLTNQPSGEQLYRIRARTLALCPAGEDCRQVRKHVYGDPSATIMVSVPLPAPTGPTVGTRTPVRLELSWTAGVGASFHEVKATTRANCNEESETYDRPSSNSATSHPLTGLTPNTSYRLCVRSVRTIGSDSLRSAWAETPATMTPAKLATPSTRAVSSSDITTNTITLRWSEVTDADGYEVKRTEGSGETTIESLPETARSRKFKGLSPSKPYTFSVRATLDDHSAATSAWASRSATTSAVTEPPPPPPPPLRQWRDCLTGTTPGVAVTYRGLSGCGPVPASLLIPNVRVVNPDVCGISRWRDGKWEAGYLLNRDGSVAPISRDFTINVGDTLGLYECSSSSAAGAAGAEAGGDFLEE